MKPTDGPRLVIWGAGELGGRLIADWPGPVLALTRTPARHELLRASGAQVALGAPPPLDQTDHLVLAIPGASAQAVALPLLRGAPRRAVLISSTGYFHGTTQREIAVETPPGPTARAAAIAGVEQSWRERMGDASVILRFGGLYRPGRGPFSALQRRRKVPPGPLERTLALIHYSDAAQAVQAALHHPAPQSTYLCVGPRPPSRGMFYAAACARLQISGPPPPHAEPAFPIYDTRSFTRDLLPDPRHPDWRAALD